MVKDEVKRVSAPAFLPIPITKSTARRLEDVARELSPAAHTANDVAAKAEGNQQQLPKYERDRTNSRSPRPISWNGRNR